MKLAAVVVAGVLLCRAAPAGAQTNPRPMNAADAFELKDIAEIIVSPDGARVLFTVNTTFLNANRMISKLMSMPAAGGQPAEVAGVPAGANTFRWSPDGTRIAFFGTVNGRNGLWVLKLDGPPAKTRRRPAAPTGVAPALIRVCDYDRGNSFISKAGNSLSWSPDGTQLAFAGTIDPPPPPQDPLVVTRIQYKTRTAFSDNRRSHIFVVPASGGKPRALTSGAFDEHSIDWGGDGSEIVFLSNREQDPDTNLNYDIFAVSVASGAIRRITETPGVEMEPRVSPDGKSIAYLATTRAVTTIDSVAEDAHVWVIPTQGGTAREINKALDRRSNAPEWTPDGKAVIYTAGDHGKTVIYRSAVDGGSAVAVVDRKAQAGPFTLARDGSMVFGLTDPAMPREIFRLAARSTKPQKLTSLNASVSGWKLVSPETITFRSFDGSEVEGWLYPALGAAGKTPMILSIHGGPHGMYGYGFNAAFQMNAARGYATLAINPRGSSGYGQTFSDGCVNNWGGGDYKDLMAGVDAVLKSHSGIDGDRLGVMGGSYGGFMTNWVITQTPRFKGAVASASLSNLVSFYATSLYQDLVHAEFNGFPWSGDNFTLLWKWSPLAYVKSVVTPTLFIHGEQDNDVHITQAEEMYTALRRRGIEAELARYPREGHGLREPKHRLDQTVRTLEWFDKYLMPGRSRPTAEGPRGR